VGRIILADFLELSLQKFQSYIEYVESDPLFTTLFCWRGGCEVVSVHPLTSARTWDANEDSSSSVIGSIRKIDGELSISYRHSGFARKYAVDKHRLEKLMTDGTLPQEQYREIEKFINRLQRISTRNIICHSILLGIISYQRHYLLSGNPLDLKPLSQMELSRQVGNADTNGVEIDNGRISRVISGTSVITPLGKEEPLKFFFRNGREIKKGFIKEILDEEWIQLEAGTLSRPYSDVQIAEKLRSIYGIKASARVVGLCRNDLGIPSFKRRKSGYKYPPLAADFSPFYSLTAASVQTDAPSLSGVYELRLNGAEIDYPKGRTGVLYIGSAKNIRDRLKSHIRMNGRNDIMEDYLCRNECLFRYIEFSRDWKREERNLYDLFVATYGESPKCNRMRP